MLWWGRRFVGGGLWGSCFVGPPPAARPCQAPCWRLQVPCLCGYVRKGSWRREIAQTCEDSRLVALSSGWTNSRTASLAGSAAIPDHHCKQTACSTNIFGELRPAESPRFKPTASPRSPTSPSSSFCTGTRGAQPKRWNSEAHSSRSGWHASADAKSSHKLTQDPRRRSQKNAAEVDFRPKPRWRSPRPSR